MQSASQELSIFVRLDKIDLLIQARQFEQAMLGFLGLINVVGGAFRWSEQRRDWRHGNLDIEVGEVCQRASAQWQALLSSEIDLARIPYQLLLPNLDTLHSVLMGTYQGSLDGYMAALHHKTGGNYQVTDVLRLILAWTPNSRLGWNPFALYKMLPEIVAAQAVATLCGMAPVSQAAEQASESALALLVSGRVSTKAFTKFGYNPMVPNAWFRCSFAAQPDRHKIKPFLGEVMAAMTGMQTDVHVAAPRNVDGKPVLLVPLEVMFRDNGLFRSHATLLSSLRKRFYTMGLGIKELVDEHATSLFDTFEYVEDPAGSGDAYKRLYTRIGKLASEKAPAMVWYPSIGMHPLTVGLAQRRLAPVQVMGFGHPASSGSPAIDYALMLEGQECSPSLATEKVVVTPPSSVPYRLPSLPRRPFNDTQPPKDGVIRVAIASEADRLTRPFIQALKQIQDKCGRSVHFVFFTGVKGALYSCAVHNLRKELLGCTYFPKLDYEDYIDELSRCHLQAGTWPFGGTDSLIDSFLCGLPVLAWKGEEPHSCVDAELVTRVGLPDSFICSSQASYAERLSALVLEPEELFRWRRFLLEEQDVRACLASASDGAVFADLLAGLLQAGG